MRRRIQRPRATRRLGTTAAAFGFALIASCSDVTGPDPIEPANSRISDASPMASPSKRQFFRDDFNGGNSGCVADGGSIGAWTVVFAGYGCTAQESSAGGSWLRMRPQAVTDAGATSAALVVGPAMPMTEARLRMITDAQLRQGSPPNPWEVGWVVWQYTDPEHFYYFIPKPNGWELGKRDPAYAGGQRFLATGNSPQFPIGRWYEIRVTQKGSLIDVYVDGRRLVRFDDTERPYLDGRFAVYNEDAETRVTDVVITR